MKRVQTERENNISDSNQPITGAEIEDSRSVWYILLLGLAPLFMLIIIGGIVCALITLDRHLISVTAFVLQQGIFIAILIIGMACAITAYALSLRRAYRKIGMWRQNGLKRQATLGQLLLVLVASMMILPVILALFLH